MPVICTLLLLAEPAKFDFLKEARFVRASQPFKDQSGRSKIDFIFHLHKPIDSIGGIAIAELTRKQWKTNRLVQEGKLTSIRATKGLEGVFIARGKVEDHGVSKATLTSWTTVHLFQVKHR